MCAVRTRFSSVRSDVAPPRGKSCTVADARVDCATAPRKWLGPCAAHAVAPHIPGECRSADSSISGTSTRRAPPTRRTTRCAACLRPSYSHGWLAVTRKRACAPALTAGPRPRGAHGTPSRRTLGSVSGMSTRRAPPPWRTTRCAASQRLPRVANRSTQKSGHTGTDRGARRRAAPFRLHLFHVHTPCAAALAHDMLHRFTATASGG